MSTGAELKATRLRLRVRTVELARAMNVKHPRVSQIEAQALVTPAAEAKYRKGLTTVLSGEPSAEAA